MKRGIFVALLAAASWMVVAAGLPAAAQSTAQESTQKPATPAAPPAQESNPFPGDTSKVPVMPTRESPAAVPSSSSSANSDDSTVGSLPLPSDSADPVRSPDDAAPDIVTGHDEATSSSDAGMDKILSSLDSDTPQQSKHKKLAVPEPEHQETPKEDMQVGQYYLDNKNWKAALSRFESAMVLAPDEPEIYWGLAESERHLGDLAAARGYYQKVAEYDPESKHGKEAIKALKDPEIANAKAATPAAPSK